jgi:hypothetical protein
VATCVLAFIFTSISRTLRPYEYDIFDPVPYESSYPMICIMLHLEPRSHHNIPYQYSPLDEIAQEIRLLRLLPSTFSSDIRVCLVPTPFTTEVIPQFEAFSYTWGSPENPVDIFVGEQGYQAISVTRNLAEALHYLRHEDNPRVLWIDAVCVNQQDLRERSLQVMRMADIYTKAEQVVVWLGPQSYDSSIALDTMMLIASKVHVDWALKRSQNLSAEAHWADTSIALPLDETQFVAISNFINRSWFERLWIWQEVRLTPKDVVVMCGNETNSWRTIKTTIFCLQRKPAQPFASSYGSKKRANDLWQLCDEINIGFDSIIDQTKYTKCTDARDRVFALLSMLDASGEKINIEPDYTKSYPEIYRGVVLRHIGYSQTLQVLTGIETHRKPELPSWVPDWSTRRPTSPLRIIHASGSSQARITVDCLAELKVMGFSIATIQRGEAFDFEEFEPSTHNRIVRHLKSIASWIGLQPPYTPGNDQLTAFCQSLCSNRFSERWYPANDNIPSLRESEESLSKILQSQATSERNFSAIDLNFLDNISRYCHHRAFFVCKDGQIVLGPREGKPGDLVTILLGCASAMVLRTSQDMTYQVVGEAYCAANMHGEALLGPFPRSFNPVLRRNGKTGDCLWGYLDGETGEVQAQDPRLGQLPQEWKMKHYEEEYYRPVFVDANTGRETIFDPRLTPENLCKRGIMAEEFHLV